MRPTAKKAEGNQSAQTQSAEPHGAGAGGGDRHLGDQRAGVKPIAGGERARQTRSNGVTGRRPGRVRATVERWGAMSPRVHIWQANIRLSSGVE